MSHESFGYDQKLVASNYLKYRPTYQPQLYDKMLSYMDKGSDGDGGRAVAVDVGCGSGQCTLALSKHFETVIGIDSSAAQLAEAKTISADHTNVVYRVGTAEQLSSVIGEEIADLVTAAAALHWFDMKTFFTECLRVLKPGGTIAAYGWPLPQWDNEEANRLINQLLRGTMEQYWQERVYLNFDHYREAFPVLKLYFEDSVRDDSLEIKFNFNLDELLGFIKSFPQYSYYKADHPTHPDDVDVLLEKLMEIYGTTSKEEKIIKGSTPVFLLMGRKSSKIL